MNKLLKKVLFSLWPLGLALGHHIAIAQDAPPPPVAETTDETFTLSEVQSGDYVLEHDHGRVHWTLSHHGFSMFTAVFPLIDARLDFNPEDISKSQLEVTVDMRAVDSSIDIFDQRLNSPAWFDTGKYPTSTYKSTQIVMTGDNRFSVTGGLTFMGETEPLTMDVTFVKAANPPRPPGGYRVGFNATATMHRSQWGMPKSTVGDEVSLSIEAEFLRPGALDH